MLDALQFERAHFLVDIGTGMLRASAPFDRALIVGR